MIYYPLANYAVIRPTSSGKAWAKRGAFALAKKTVRASATKKLSGNLEEISIEVGFDSSSILSWVAFIVFSGPIRPLPSPPFLVLFYLGNCTIRYKRVKFL